MTRLRRGILSLSAVAMLPVLVPAGVASGHSFTLTDVLAILKADGTYQIDMRVDVDALALGVSSTVESSLIAAELRGLSAADLEAVAERAISTIRRRVQIEFDGQRQRDPVIRLPQRGTPLLATSSEPTILGTVVRLEGSIPEDAAVFTFGASRAFQAVHLTIVDLAGGSVVKHVLDPGARSPAHRIGRAPEAESRVNVAARYVILGFEHILPKGLDHILFVLGLFLLSTKWRPLLWQITAFTIAHSVTLALSMGGVVSLPSRFVETLIAFSIAYVAVENLFTTELKPWRPALVFMFGLLHGLGFAGMLRELGLPSGEFVTALVGFNIGVEVGQITVVLIAFALVGWFRERGFYRKGIVIPASALIAATGIYWAAERAMLAS